MGELLRFFFLLDALGEGSGVGLGEDFFFFAEADGLGDGVSDGVGLAVAFFFGDGDFSGVALGFSVGDFSAVDFFFVRLCGVGVGVGAKTFLSLSPNDSSARAWTTKPVSIAQTIRVTRSARILESERSTSADCPGPQMEPARPRAGGNTRRGYSTA